MPWVHPVSPGCGDCNGDGMGMGEGSGEGIGAASIGLAGDTFARLLLYASSFSLTQAATPPGADVELTNGCSSSAVTVARSAASIFRHCDVKSRSSREKLPLGSSGSGSDWSANSSSI